MLKEILEQFLTAAKSEIIEAQKDQGLIASGASVNSYTVNVKGTESYLVGSIENLDYWQFVNDGRAGGKFPPISAIKDWCEQKGLFNSISKEYQKNGLAFVIARSIAQNGSKAWQKGGNNLLASITDQRLQVLNDSILSYKEKEVTDEITISFYAK